ncbi:MAG: hypothetical protein ACRDSJ_03000 [Rubrobacteraceae bacterium]
MSFPAQTVADLAGAGIAAVALAVSALGLFLSRRDRKARLEILVRYEYRAISSRAPARARGGSQEELIASLGDFLRAHDLGYADGEAVVSFVLRNRGSSAIYPRTARLLLLSGGRENRDFAGLLACRDRPLVVDPGSGRVRAAELSGGAEDVATYTDADRRLPEQISPGRSLGVWCGLSPLSRVLVSEGHAGRLELALQVRDQLGNVFTAPFRLDTEIWDTARTPNRGRRT